MATGDDGIYRLYRLYPADGRCDQRLIAVFGIFGGKIVHIEDHDRFLRGPIPEGRLTSTVLRRLQSLDDSGYWRLVNEDDIERGLHPDLVAHASEAEKWK